MPIHPCRSIPPMIGVLLIYASAMKNSPFNSVKSGTISMSYRWRRMALTMSQAVPRSTETALDSVRTGFTVALTKNFAAASIRRDFRTIPKVAVGVAAEHTYFSSLSVTKTKGNLATHLRIHTGKSPSSARSAITYATREGISRGTCELTQNTSRTFDFAFGDCTGR